MRLFLSFVTFVLVAGQAAAEAPSYKPKEGLLGSGYRENIEKDGTLRVITEYSSRDTDAAVNIGLYRVAILAREAGMPYVQVLGVKSYYSNGVVMGYVYARPTTDPSAPAACWRGVKTCYTAEVGKAIDGLSGPNGAEPGKVKLVEADQYGRTVLRPAFGIGAVAWLR